MEVLHVVAPLLAMADDIPRKAVETEQTVWEMLRLIPLHSLTTGAQRGITSLWLLQSCFDSPNGLR